MSIVNRLCKIGQQSPLSDFRLNTRLVWNNASVAAAVRFCIAAAGHILHICCSFEAFAQSRIRKNGQSMRNRFLAVSLIAPLLVSGSLTNADALPLLGHPPAL